MSLASLRLCLFGVVAVLANSDNEGAPPCQCGAPSYSNNAHKRRSINLNDGKIIRGTDAERGEFPWLLQLRYKKHSACGASLISPSFAVSALHCFSGDTKMAPTIDNPEDWDVVAGAHFRSENSELLVWRKIKKIHVPKEFVTKYGKAINKWQVHLGYDIVVLELDEPVEPRAGICFICMPGTDDYGSLDGTIQKANKIECTVSGWGKIDPNAEPPDNLALQKLSVDLVDREECKHLLSKEDVTFSEDSFCAGQHDLPEPGDSCEGDSGGALGCRQIHPNGHSPYELAGVVSWGVNCSAPNLPGVYANVHLYMNWIKSIVADEPLYYAE